MVTEAGINLFLRYVNVSRETIECLKLYESEIIKWNPAINLVSKSSISDMWVRHFLDSAQIWQQRPESVKSWLDLGSGAGFPGVIVALLAKNDSPMTHITLVESDKRKAAFLINICHLLKLTVTVAQQRAETLRPQKADVISARALAPLDKLLNYADRHCEKHTIMLFQKGEKVESELTQARKYWTFNANKTPSVTHSGGVLLQIGGLGRVKT